LCNKLQQNQRPPEYQAGVIFYYGWQNRLLRFKKREYMYFTKTVNPNTV